MPNIIGTTSGAADTKEPAAWLVFTKPNRPNSYKVAITNDINGRTTKNIIFPDDTVTMCGLEVNIPSTSTVENDSNELKTVERYVMYCHPFTLKPKFVVRRSEATSVTDNQKLHCGIGSKNLSCACYVSQFRIALYHV